MNKGKKHTFLGIVTVNFQMLHEGQMVQGQKTTNCVAKSDELDERITMQVLGRVQQGGINVISSQLAHDDNEFQVIEATIDNIVYCGFLNAEEFHNDAKQVHE